MNRPFIYHMCILCFKTFHNLYHMFDIVTLNFDLLFKTLTLAITFFNWNSCMILCTFFVSKLFTLYNKFCPYDLDLEV